MPLSRRLSLLRVRPLAGTKARGWLTAGPFRIPCALGPAGIVRLKREGDGGTPAGRFRLLWGYYRPDRLRPRAAGVPLKPMRPDQGWCEDPASPRYNRPVRLPAADCTDRMWRDDRLYDLTFVLDQNFTRRAKGRGSAIFFHLARPGLSPTAGCVAIRPADMRSSPRSSPAARRWRLGSAPCKSVDASEPKPSRALNQPRLPGKIDAQHYSAAGAHLERTAELAREAPHDPHALPLG